MLCVHTHTPLKASFYHSLPGAFLLAKQGQIRVCSLQSVHFTQKPHSAPARTHIRATGSDSKLQEKKRAARSAKEQAAAKHSPSLHYYFAQNGTGASTEKQTQSRACASYTRDTTDHRVKQPQHLVPATPTLYFRRPPSRAQNTVLPEHARASHFSLPSKQKNRRTHITPTHKHITKHRQRTHPDTACFGQAQQNHTTVHKAANFHVFNGHSNRHARRIARERNLRSKIR